MATDKTKRVSSFIWGSFKECFEHIAKINENTNPDIAQSAKEVGILVSKIIFLIKTASLPENINAKILYKTAFLLYSPFWYRIYVPNIISKMPAIADNDGISFK